MLFDQDFEQKLGDGWAFLLDYVSINKPDEQISDEEEAMGWIWKLMQVWVADELQFRFDFIQRKKQLKCIGYDSINEAEIMTKKVSDLYISAYFGVSNVICYLQVIYLFKIRSSLRYDEVDGF